MQIRSCFLLALLLGWGHGLSADVLYSVTDLGPVTAFAINNAGQITGSSSTFSGGGHAVLYRDGQITDLGTLAGDIASFGIGINDAGQVTGASVTTFGAFRVPPVQHAFLYSNGQMMDLGTLDGNSSVGNSVNNSGQVTGFSDSRAFVYSNGQMTDLGTFGGSSSSGNGINDSGQVVGQFDTPAGSHGFVYSNGQAVDLGPGIASAINNAGQVTGSLFTFPGRDHTFLYSNGEMMDLGDGRATGINNSGQVTGFAFAADIPFPRPGPHALLFSNGQRLDLNDMIDPSLGITLFEARSINDKGQIVADGAYSDSGGRSFLLTPVPEPSTLALFGVALSALWFWSGRRPSVLR